MTLTTDLDFINAGYPTKAEMIDMVNADLLPHWHHYDGEEFIFTSRFTAIGFESSEQQPEMFTLQAEEADEEGKQLRTLLLNVPSQYFIDWQGWKRYALAVIDKQL